jgi:hypothetical protein
MKHLYLLFFCLLLLSSCQKADEQIEEKQTGNTETGSVSQFNLPQVSNDHLVSIYETQELIKMEQANVDLRKKFCDLGYYEDHKVFISIGIGRLRNPATGQPIPRHMSERAANIDAMRWASYGKKWLENNYKPAFGEIESFFNKPVEIIDKAVVGDSLFIFMATKIN